MLTDCGMVWIVDTVNGIEPPAMPSPKAAGASCRFYSLRTLGYGRQYAAMGAKQQVDAVIRVYPEGKEFCIGQYVVDEHGTQYRMDNVQQLLDEHGLWCCDLTLRRLENYSDTGEGTPCGIS